MGAEVASTAAVPEPQLSATTGVARVREVILTTVAGATGADGTRGGGLSSPLVELSSSPAGCAALVARGVAIGVALMLPTTCSGEVGSWVGCTTTRTRARGALAALSPSASTLAPLLFASCMLAKSVHCALARRQRLRHAATPTAPQTQQTTSQPHTRPATMSLPRWSAAARGDSGGGWGGRGGAGDGGDEGGSGGGGSDGSGGGGEEGGGEGPGGDAGGSEGLGGGDGPGGGGGGEIGGHEGGEGGGAGCGGSWGCGGRRGCGGLGGSGGGVMASAVVQ